MKTIPMSKNLLLAALTFLSLTISCSKSNDNNPSPGGSPGANEVWLQNTKYNPTPKIVAVSTTVTWINKDANAHTVTSDLPMFDSGTLSSGDAFSYQFTTTGTFTYHCNFHSTMKGTIVVQ